MTGITVRCGRCAADVPISDVRLQYGPPDAPDFVAGFDAAMHYLRWQRPKLPKETAMLGGWETR